MTTFASSGYRPGPATYFIVSVLGLGGHVLLRLSGLSLEVMIASAFAIAIAMVIGSPLGLLVGHVMSREGDRGESVSKPLGTSNRIAPALTALLNTLTAQLALKVEHRRGARSRLAARLVFLVRRKPMDLSFLNRIDAAGIAIPLP